MEIKGTKRQDIWRLKEQKVLLDIDNRVNKGGPLQFIKNESHRGRKENSFNGGQVVPPITS